MSYARDFRTLTRAESRALLAVSKHAGYRDHILFSLALGTGLRAHEALALNVGQLLNRKRKGRARIELVIFKGWESNGGTQSVPVPDALRHKLSDFGRWKKRHGEPLELEAPVFVSRCRRRLTDRALRFCFVKWRRLAELADSLTYHSLRHTFCQRLYEQEHDIRLVQIAARHKNMTTTTEYAGPSEEMIDRAVRRMEC
ncbi:MAG: site-specific integrase [Myxococcales bacterium]|nr:site-specific integrase [Myxococcales bacterium]